MDAQALEKLRRGFPLRRSAGGSWWIGDEPVTHGRTVQVLTAGLDLSDNGEPIVFVGPQWSYVHLGDTALRVTGVDPGPTGLQVRLDDGRQLPLDLSSLWEEADAGLRCEVPSQRLKRPLSARFTAQAMGDISPFLRWDDALDQPVLVVGATRWPIPSTHPARRTPSTT